MKFSEELFDEVKEIWDEYLKHPFVKGIGEGTLDKEKFKNYLIQDYLYLKDYAKVFAMGLVKARSMKEMKFYHESIKGVLDDETAVHVNYLKGFGLSTDEVEKYKVELTTASYTKCTQEWIDYIDEICENISEDEKERLKDIFIKSSLYEMEFWNMANK